MLPFRVIFAEWHIFFSPVWWPDIIKLPISIKTLRFAVKILISGVINFAIDLNLDKVCLDFF